MTTIGGVAAQLDLLIPSIQVHPNAPPPMRRIALQISADSHQLLQPTLHDGRLLSISLPADRIVELFVRDVAGTCYCIHLDGVVEFNAMSFREGNIILDITIIRGEDVQLHDLALLAFEETDRQMSDVHLKWLHDRVLAEALSVIQLNPSYGCQLAGVARNVSVLRMDEKESSGL